MTAVAALIGIATTGSMILEWSFLSMGLRGAGSFIPFVAAVLKPGLLPPVWALASCCGGLAAMLAWAFARMPATRSRGPRRLRGLRSLRRALRQKIPRAPRRARRAELAANPYKSPARRTSTLRAGKIKNSLYCKNVQLV